MFEQEIERYEQVRAEYQKRIVQRMDPNDYMSWHEVLFSCHSCAIEGNSFTLDDTRILQEQGLAMVPNGHSLLECTEMADHFRAFRYVTTHLDVPFDEALLRETNRLVTENTLAFRVPGAIAGEYTTQDMAAGDTVFGDHKKLIARVPHLMSSTAQAMEQGIHPMIVAARFHGFFEYLHPFRDGNGRTGRLLSNWILLRAGHPLVIIDVKDRSAYIKALRQIHSEGTDEFLISFFFDVSIGRMSDELEQKKKNTNLRSFLF
ncbi:MAG: Fic family protein [Muribaculaceae bacterium]|nr:Fic family protein [Muribaculaceae bacterium]